MKIKTKPHLGRRIGATIFDYGLTTMFFIFYAYKFGEHDPINNSYSVYGIKTLPVHIYWFIYHILIEYLFGSTAGHFIFDLKVRRLNGSKTNLWQNIKRHILDVIDMFMFGIPAVIAINNTTHNQRLGDLWAKTIVVHKSDITKNNY